VLAEEAVHGVVLLVSQPHLSAAVAGSPPCEQLQAPASLTRSEQTSERPGRAASPATYGGQVTTVLVHGVPETSTIWDHLREALDLPDVVALELPGFGCPLPEGFGATKEEYVEWMAGELERIGTEEGSPPHVLGHDWGGGFVVRIVSTRPELVRSWVTDAGGMGSGSFEWHALAKIWQTPGEGEAYFAALAEQPVENVAAVFESLGIPASDALGLAGAMDGAMATAILALYRSAVDVGEEWSPDFHDIPRPGLVLVPSDDPFGEANRSLASGERTGARTAQLDGLGHWWMLQSPGTVAPVLKDFWASVEGRAAANPSARPRAGRNGSETDM
jgi:pimeloyl-ACP methyl ester carboxylesterase